MAYIYGAELAGGTATARKKYNDLALQIVKSGQAFKTLDQDQRLIVQAYSGLGGIGISKDQYYTPALIARFAWQLAYMAGSRGAVLEPACGSGVFFKAALGRDQGFTEITGVEIDKNAAQVADYIWSEQAAVLNQSFERFASTCLSGSRRFGLVIGNSPFGIRGTVAQDKEYRNLKNHELYFLARGLDLLQNNGILAMLVPAGVLNSAALEKFRGALLDQKRAQFLGAWRFTDQAFIKSGAAVCTDLLIFRKFGQDCHLWDLDDLESTKAFKLGASAVFADGCKYGSIIGEKGIDRWGRDTITGSYSVDDLRAALKAFKPDAPLTPDPNAGKTPAATPAKAEEMKQDQETKPQQQDPALLAAIQLGQDIEQLVFLQKNNPSQANAMREEISKALDFFMATFGNPNSLDILSGSKKSAILTLLASVDNSGAKASIFNETTHHSIKPSSNIELPVIEAIKASIRESVDQTIEAPKLNPEDLALVESDPDLIFIPGTNKITFSSAWAAGDVYSKLDQVLSLPESEPKQKYLNLLKSVMKITPLEKAHISLRDGWIPLQYKNDFLAYYDANFRDGKYRAWNFGHIKEYQPGAYAVITYYRDKENGAQEDQEIYQSNDAELLELWLNHRGTGGRNESRIERIEQVAEWDNLFREWVLSHPKRAHFENLYNRSFNGWIQQKHSDQPLKIKGFNFTLHGYQNENIRQMWQTISGIDAMDVGLGKTLKNIAKALLFKQNGRCNKPAFVVPKSVLSNWKREIERSTHGLKVIYVGEVSYIAKSGKNKGKIVDRAMTPQEREKALKSVALNNPDMVIFTDSAFEMIQLSPDALETYGDNQFYNSIYGEQLTDYKRAKAKDQHNYNMTARQFLGASEYTYFDDLGIDALFYDEASALKNMYKSRQSGRIMYLGSGEGAKRSWDFNSKAAYLQHKNIFLLTATPSKNNPLEIYNMISHIAPGEFTKRGIYNVEQFIDHFGEIETIGILTPSGGYEEKECLIGFKNLDVLRSILFKYTYMRSAEEVGLKLPKPDHSVMLSEMDEAQELIYTSLRDRAFAGLDGKEKDHVFKMMHEMEIASFYPQMKNGDLFPVDYYSPKMMQVCTNVLKQHKTTDTGQLIFTSDLFVDSHLSIKNCLIDLGVPANLIGIMNGQTCKTSAARQRMGDLFNAGEIKILIGNDGIMAEGMNLQENTGGIHHATLPWTPSDLQQRNGRGLRQGNTLESVLIFTYFAKRTFDAFRHQALERKANWIGHLWRSKADRYINHEIARGGFDPGELRIALSPDPEAAIKMLEQKQSDAEAQYMRKKRVNIYQEYQRMQKLEHRSRIAKTLEGKSRFKTEVDRILSRLQESPLFTHKQLLTPCKYGGFADVLIIKELGIGLAEGDYIQGSFLSHTSDTDAAECVKPISSTPWIKRQPVTSSDRAHAWTEKKRDLIFKVTSISEKKAKIDLVQNSGNCPYSRRLQTLEPVELAKAQVKILTMNSDKISKAYTDQSGVKNWFSEKVF